MTYWPAVQSPYNKKKTRGMAVIPYVEGVSEKFKLIYIL